MRHLLCVMSLFVLALSAQQPERATIATHYFYWYHWPTEHFDEPGAPGHEGHCHHLVDPEKVSYRSADWHAQNFADMAAAGIDVALPVYWGAPHAYERPNLAFSRLGLPPMITALDRMAEAGEAAPKLGLFYDTSTLANDVCGRSPRGGKADLTTDAGRELFCTTITDYFAAIPQRHWARHRGGALVVTYVSGFAAAWDNGLGDALRERFAARFPGEQVCFVADVSWGDVGQDLSTSWGAALWGPRVLENVRTKRTVMQIGPGYDDRAVPGRRTPVREREDGAFYRWSWQMALRQRPELVLLETWNELHEGTELCPTKELGRQYVELTRRYVDLLRAGKGDGESVQLQWPEPRPQPDRSWGKDADGRAEVFADFATGERVGLREVASEDGPCRVDGGVLVAGTVPDGMGSYLYLQVSDWWAFDVNDGEGSFELEVRRKPDDHVAVEYDSHDPGGALHGAYTWRRPRSSERDGEWLVETYALPRARLANRENAGADLRFVLSDRRASIARVTLLRR
ncbi:MAG: hypothetical protein H6835_16625 [Planctomycetes bacterium]|nr:hypothetical protein [Planctomycetota bacterium]